VQLVAIKTTMTDTSTTTVTTTATTTTTTTNDHEGIAKFVELADDDRIYLAQQLLILFNLKHEQRVLLFHQPFLEDEQYLAQLNDNNVKLDDKATLGEQRGICRGMLRALYKISWKEYVFVVFYLYNI
jgi:hypothetical protein